MGTLLNPKSKKVILTIFILFIAIMTIMPFVFMISSAFKYDSQMFTNPLQLIPSNPTFKNFRHLFEHDMFYRWYLNTIWVVFIIIGLRFVLVTTAAYAFARLEFKGRDAIFFFLLTTMMITPDTTVVPRYLLFKYLGLMDSMWAIIASQLFDVFFVFLVRQFFLTLPKDISEAAIIDGCSHFKVYYKIVLPLVKPALVTMVLFSFIWSWNDFISPYVFITSRHKQLLSVGLQYFQGEIGPKVTLQMAAASLAVIPCVIMFACTQKYFVRGIVGSGLKG